MIGFVIAVAVLLAAAVAIILPPILRTSSPEEVERKKINVAIGKERLAELNAARESGELTDNEFERERRELEESLLEDIEGDSEQTGSSIRNLWAIATLLILVPALSLALYAYLGMPAALNMPDTAQSADQKELPSIEEMVATLEQRLQQDPDNVEGWSILARTYMVMQQYEKAAEALYRLRELVGDNPDVLSDIADAVAMKQGGSLDGEPIQLLRQALEIDPSQLKALWLVGMYEYQRGNAAEALVYWRKLEPMLVNDPESRNELQQLITRAEEQAGGAVPAMPEQEVTGTNGALTVSVSMGEEMIGKFSADDTLFVFARAKSGPPMPLAVYRGRASDLPITITLDDSMAMTPMMKLSSFEEVAVMARISSSGQAKPASGDLLGIAPGTVVPGQDQPVEIIINQVQE